MFESVKNQYYYNNRNWITEFNNTDGIFNYSNDYFKNGKVKSQNLTGSYRNDFTRDDEIGFNFRYDESNRLLGSTLISTIAKNDYSITNTYDKDGNILTLDRYGSDENLLDDFTYTYYSGTNKLRRVFGSGTHYTYDYNGNMLFDSLNNNSEIKYDHRNLITQLKHRSHIITDSSYYVSFYKYDEAGNRIEKKTYKYLGAGNPDMPSEYDIPADNDWEMVHHIIYSRDLSGRELAVYDNPNLVQWNVYGLDNIGRISPTDKKFYYLKDHLGSVRATVNELGAVMNSQDGACPRMLLAGDPCLPAKPTAQAGGYILQDRQYEGVGSRYLEDSNAPQVASPA